MLALALQAPLSGRAETTDAEAAESAAPAEETASGKPETLSNRLKPRLSARLRIEYDYRTQGDASDSDLYGRFHGSADDLYDGHLDIYMSARLHADLDDSESASFAEDPYRDLDDADGVTEERLLQMYGDLHSRDKRAAIRVGRQYIDAADYLQLDGGQIMLNENGNVGGRVYVGRPVSYYTSVSDDYAAGVSLAGRPWEGNQTRLTLARYHDESEDGNDQNYYLDMRQRITDSSRLRGQLSVLNDEFRMGQADWFYYSLDGETDLAIGGSYWGAFDAETRAYSPLYNTLGEQDPYAFTYARLTQQIAPRWMLSPGVSLRFAEESDNAYNNRDYENYDITLIYEPSRSLSASLSLEFWTVEPDDDFFGLSGALRYRHGRIWEVSGGASFSEYTYDTYSDISYTVNGGQTVFSESGTVIQESPYVYTYFIRGKWRISRMYTLRLQFDIEDDDEAEDLAYRGRGSVEVRF
jgi:hypothetical protein